MMALLIKDWRLNAPATLCLVLIYAVLPFIVLVGHAADEGMRRALANDTLVSCFVISAISGLGISLLIIPAFGGIAFARERRDRSGEFLVAHPIRRSNAVASKVMVAMALCTIPWILSAAYLAIAWGLVGSADGEVQNFRADAEGFREGFSWLFRFEVMLFGISWLFSSILRSETLATAATILGTILVSLGYAFYRSRLERFGLTPSAEAAANAMAMMATLSLGISGFITGTIIALRRVSP